MATNNSIKVNAPDLNLNLNPNLNLFFPSSQQRGLGLRLRLRLGLGAGNAPLNALAGIILLWKGKFISR
jgi:hypothetical protein